jgi:hypothetical protein
MAFLHGLAATARPGAGGLAQLFAEIVSGRPFTKT